MVAEIQSFFNCFLSRIPGFPDAYADKKTGRPQPPQHIYLITAEPSLSMIICLKLLFSTLCTERTELSYGNFHLEK